MGPYASNGYFAVNGKSPTVSRALVYLISNTSIAHWEGRSAKSFGWM
jgi:hypothetical protein